MHAAEPHWSLGRRIAPPRFLLAAAVLIVGTALAIPRFGWSVGFMIGFVAAAAVFLLAMAPMILRSRPHDMRVSAVRNDANRTGLLVVTAVMSLGVLTAVYGELRGRQDALSIALVLATLVLAWLFSNTVYAFHYAHVFYTAAGDGSDTGGLAIPKTSEPDYLDFIYFSFTLGMTFQTSDVEIESATMRRIVLGQCLAAFFFNLGVLAFTINVLGGP